MTWSGALLALAFLAAALIQYGLALYTIRDLSRREKVRGPNRIAWGLIILCLPFVGPLLYAMLATDGLPPPPRQPASTWPGRRWRAAREVGRRATALVDAVMAPRERPEPDDDEWRAVGARPDARPDERRWPTDSV